MSSLRPYSPAALGHESVLSTRSLPFVSNVSSPNSPGFPPAQQSRNPSMSLARSHRWSSVLNDNSEDEDLEMTDSRTDRAERTEERGSNNIPELPESVANSLLFELPREIRDRIYSFCLAARDGLPVEWPTGWRALSLQPQLLRTCKIVHDEATPLLYSLNAMTFHHPSDANMFVRAISSPYDSRYIANLSLHIKAQDTRLWMPYLTSTDSSRSLKADFPNLRELGVRFRSNKWQHQHPPATNLKHWSEDSRLDEVIDGLRNVFLPSSPAEPSKLNDNEFEEILARNPLLYPTAGNDMALKMQMAEYAKARSDYTTARANAPNIRVCCACRVHSAHFNALTIPYASDPSGNHANQRPPSPFVPVREGDAFHGFTPVDLQNGVKKLHDPDLGSANVARTPYADKHGILIALEIHCLDPKKDSGERAA